VIVELNWIFSRKGAKTQRKNQVLSLRLCAFAGEITFSSLTDDGFLLPQIPCLIHIYITSPLHFSNSNEYVAPSEVPVPAIGIPGRVVSRARANYPNTHAVAETAG